MTVHLRLRTPNGREINSTDQGLPTDLPGLVEKIIIEIKKATGSTSAPLAGQTQSEAREYFFEGLWGWQHHADDAALEALDSAELLGADIANVTAVRINVLTDLIDNKMENWRPNDPADDKPSLDGNQLSQKADYAFRDIDDMLRFRDKKFPSQPQLLKSPDSEDQYRPTHHWKADVAVFAISKLLFLLDEAHSPRADELRQSLRSITGYDPHPPPNRPWSLPNFGARGYPASCRRGLRQRSPPSVRVYKILESLNVRWLQ